MILECVGRETSSRTLTPTDISSPNPKYGLKYQLNYSLSGTRLFIFLTFANDHSQQRHVTGAR